MKPPPPSATYLPELGTNLVTTLTGLNVNNFSHGDFFEQGKKEEAVLLFVIAAVFTARVNGGFSRECG